MSKDAPKDEWTMSLGVSAGDKLRLEFHAVEVREILRTERDFCVARVHVLGPVIGSAGYTDRGHTPLPIPPLMWKGELYDTAGTFVDQTKS